MRDENELSLIAKAKAGDKDALTEIIVECTPLLKKVTRTYFVDGMDREDLLQEATLALIKAVDKFDENGGQKLTTFIYSVAKQRLLDLIKKNSAKKGGKDAVKLSIEGGEDNDGIDPEAIGGDVIDDYLQKETAEQLYKISDEVLTKREKAFFDLYLQEKSYREIAEELGVSTKTVDNTLSKIKKKIREKKDVFN